MEFNHPVGDYHVHPDFSADARGSLREYCQKAAEIGLAEIIFTTHADSNSAFGGDCHVIIDGHKHPVNAESLKRYREAVYDLVDGNDPVPLMVRCGVEVDFFPGIKDSFLAMIEDLHFDYVLAGVHFVDEYILTEEKPVRALVAKRSPQEIISSYYRVVQQACRVPLFDALAHLDVYRRLGMRFFPEEAARIDYPIIDETLACLREAGLPIEVNTSGIRHGIGDWYPSKPLLNKARQAGVLIGGLGSDAHAPEQLAGDFELAHLIVHETFPSLYED